MIDERKIAVCFFLFSLPFVCHFFGLKAENGFHTAEERKHWKTATVDTLFLTSSRCQQCHGHDTAQIASITAEGEDINLFDDWKVTMMANSAKDPFWRAKVSHEVLVNPGHQQEIETTCTSCHAPLGHFAAMHQQQTHYTMADLLADTLGLDGVSCLACHQQADTTLLGFNHSGSLFFDTTKVAYGPFDNPLASPMLNETNYEPKFSEHISDAGLCAGCHTLITHTFDLNGMPTGNTFVEQATYHEWLNSRYNTDDISCQNCHLSALNGNFILIAGHDTEPRSPFYLHEMVGGNSLMLQLMKNNAAALDIDATPEQFDEVIDATYNLLQFQTLNLELSLLNRTLDTAFFELNLVNKAGHKFPSGYPSRRALVSFLVQTETGDTLFHSGKMDSTYEVFGQDAPFESHHQTIRTEDEVQIYEMVMADVAGNFTTILDRANHLLKDNRLVPEGFTSSHSTYDTTQIVGLATDDPDFNTTANGIEGNGADKIFFNIPLDGLTDSIVTTAAVYYQTAPPKWMAEMFAESTPEIDAFKNMFMAADRSPVLIQQQVLGVEGIPVSVTQQKSIEKFVILTTLPGGRVGVASHDIHQVTAFDASGKMILQREGRRGWYSLQLPKQSGMYFLRFTDRYGRIQIEKTVQYYQY